MNKKCKALLALFLVICMGLCVKPIRDTLEPLIFLFQLYDVGFIKGYILSFGIWAPIVSSLLMIFQSVIAPLPAFLITFANAALFGWVKGAILSWLSAMAGASLCFFISNYFGRNTAEKLATKLALKNMDGFFKQYGMYTILIARLLPFVSFDIVSYAAGLTSMRFSSFFWATGLGQLPATIIYSYAGEMLTGGVKQLVFGLLLLFALSFFLLLLKKIGGKGIFSKSQPQTGWGR